MPLPDEEKKEAPACSPNMLKGILLTHGDVGMELGIHSFIEVPALFQALFWVLEILP